MIAVVTSTLQPTAGKSYFNYEERLRQTKYTLSELLKLDFQKIMLFDNSGTLNQTELNELLKDFPSIEKYHARQFQFDNKGFNEALLILNNLHNLPDGIPVFKLSGRYYPTERFNIVDNGLFSRYEIIGAGVDFNTRISGFSTRAYFVKNKQVLKSTLVLATEEMLAYGRGVHGLKSLIKSIVNFYKPPIGTEYQLSLEQAFAQILKHKKNYLLLDNLHVEGYIAGSDHLDLVKD